MATIINPPNSFVQFNNGNDIVVGAPEPVPIDCISDCSDPIDICLPLHEITDLEFQIILSDSDAPFREDFVVALYAGSDCPLEVTELDFIETYGGSYINIFELNETTHIVTFNPETPLYLCNTLSAYTCLKIVLYNASSGVTYGCSNCFYFEPDTCYTTLLKYRCNENSFGFYYDEDILDGPVFYNKVRLRITLHSPDYPKTKKTFRLSNGTYKKLFAVIQMQVECLVDDLDKNLHRCLTVAIEHDELYIYNDDTLTFDQYDSDEAEYEIAWNETPGNYRRVAQAKFKLKADPFFNINTNC